MDQEALIDNVTLRNSFEEDKKISQEINQEGEESNFGEETKSEDEDSKLEFFKDDDDDMVMKIDEDEDDDDLSLSRSLRSTYEDCRDDETNKCKLYLFARADREKEDW